MFARRFQGLSRAFSSSEKSAGQKLSYFACPKGFALKYKSISQQLRDTTAKHPDRFAVFSEHENLRLTYGEFLRRVEEMAAGLLALGLQKGARVGVFAPTALDYYTVQVACAMSDLILVNINPAYRQQELEYAVNKVDCEVLFIVSKLKTTDYEAMVRKLVPDIETTSIGTASSKVCPSLRYIIHFDDHAGRGFLKYTDIFKLGRSEENIRKMKEIESRIQPEDITNIQFTSGTTGSPKATMLSHFNLVNNGAIIANQLDFDENSKILCSVPLYHCFGMVICNLAALSVGSEVLFPHATFEGPTSLKVASEKGATSLYGVPTMFIEFINQVEKHPGKYNLSKVKNGVMAGSICPRPLMEKVRDLLNCKGMLIGYGMTETSPISFMTSTSDPIEKQVSTVGRVVPNTECKLVDTEGKTVSLGERGEICTRGYMVMRGYWKDEKATASAIDEHGWMHTGDVGVFDEKGYLSIAGRIKDMINRGGEKIFPKEIEEFLLKHPKVFNVQVFPFPDEKFGEEVFCWIRVKDGMTMDHKEVLDYCLEKIAHYKIPKYLKFVTDFPITVTGKPQKFKMTDEMVREVKADPNVLVSYMLRGSHKLSK